MRLRTRWVRGPRLTIPQKGKGGQETTVKGKNGGDVIKQHVEKIIEPAVRRKHD